MPEPTFSTPMEIFRLEELSFAYTQDGENAHDVLHDVTFSLCQGQHVGLYGPNGSGKTTLFRCITGLLRPQHGRVYFHQHLVENKAHFHALRCHVGFVLQHADDQLFFPTVLEDVAFGPLNLGMTENAARERALETLRSLGLVGFENRLTHRLSGGEKKLVSLAAVLAMRPEALLLDEPSNDLDASARERLMHILHEIPTARITISHDWEFLASVSQTFITIDQGHLSDCAPFTMHAHKHAHPLGDTPHGHTGHGSTLHT